VFVFITLIVNFISASGTEFKCEATLPSTHTINTCVTNEDVTTCYCDEDDCNVKKSKVPCYYKAGTAELTTKTTVNCQQGIVNCKQVKTSK
jgi:hypothetical protein